MTKQGMSTVDLKLTLENAGVTSYKRYDRTRDEDIQNVLFVQALGGEYAFISYVVIEPGANRIDRQCHGKSAEFS